MSNIFKDLCDLNLTSESSCELFRKGTRDNTSLNVYKDKISGIIFIKDFYVGEEEYISGEYRGEKKNDNFDENNGPRKDFGRYSDCKRRCNEFQPFYVKKDILDFGCGHGDFLLETKNLTKSSIGVELQTDLSQNIRSKGINCYKDMENIADQTLDTIFLFHVFEHFSSPRKILKDLYRKLKVGGKIILEVPNANDFLISHLKEESFIKFTLWSQHLILHSFYSLEIFLKDANFSEIILKGVQRYPLSNHLNWIKNHKPGGHQSILAFLDSEGLTKEYEKTLSSINATDTIVAIATK